MDVRYEIRRIVDVIRAIALSHSLARHDRWSREAVSLNQQTRLTALVRYARTKSPFYRDLYRHIDPARPVVLEELPRIDKRTMMENFDRFVTDPRLKLKALQEHLGTLQHDAYYLGEYRVLATAGTTGMRGVFAFNRREWSVELANVLRWQRMMTVRPRLFPRLRVSAIGAGNPIHVSERLTDSGNVGLFRLQRLAVTTPLATLVAELNEFQPDVLLSYPSLAAILVDEQMAGRLRIRPRVVSTHSERLPGHLAHMVAQAWGTRPFNHYGLTEVSTIGAECSHHVGMHLLDDLFIAEIVDEKYRPVGPGTLGRQLMLTNLYNMTQPLIRYEVSDRLELSPWLCKCGRPFPLIAKMAGRSEESVSLSGESGQHITVSPLVIDSVIETFDAISEFQIVVSGGALRIRFVPRGGRLSDQELYALTGELRARMERFLGAPVKLTIEQAVALERGGMGKLQVIRTEPPDQAGTE